MVALCSGDFKLHSDASSITPLLCTIKPQKRVESKVDESVLKTTRCTKQSVNRTALYGTQSHTLHQDLHVTSPHYTHIHFTSHPALIPFSSPQLANRHPRTNAHKHSGTRNVQERKLKRLCFLNDVFHLR